MSKEMTVETANTKVESFLQAIVGFALIIGAFVNLGLKIGFGLAIIYTIVFVVGCILWIRR